MENKMEEVNLNLDRVEKKITLEFLGKEMTEEFSTEEDAIKAENISKSIMKLIQGLINMGATFSKKEELPEE